MTSAVFINYTSDFLKRRMCICKDFVRKYVQIIIPDKSLKDNEDFLY